MSSYQRERTPVRQNVDGPPARQQYQPLATNGNGARGQLATHIVETLNQSMSRLQPFIEGILTPDKLISLLSLMANRNPELQKCDPLSIVDAVIQATSLGLDITPTKGEAWLIPRFDKRAGTTLCNFQPGYRGLCKLMKASGEVQVIQCRLVYDTEPFLVEYNPELVFRHKPDLEAPGDSSRVRYAYCYVRTRSGEPIVEVMNRRQIEASRNRGKSQYGPWSTDWEAMAKRCPVIPMSKWITMDDKLARAFEAMYTDDEDDEPGKATTTVATGSAGLQAKLEQTRGRNGQGNGHDPAGAALEAPGYREMPPDEAMPAEPEEPPAKDAPGEPALALEAWVQQSVDLWCRWWLDEAQRLGITLDGQHRAITSYDQLLNGLATDAIDADLIDGNTVLIPSKEDKTKLVRGRRATVEAVRALYHDQPSECNTLLAQHIKAKAEKWTRELAELASLPLGGP